MNMIDYEEEDRTFVVESAIKNNLGTKDEICLYEQLSIAMEFMDNKEFNIVESNINNGINFGISTRFPHGLPEEVGSMFFNIDMNYNVSVKETSRCVYAGERFFDINLKKN